VSVAAFVDAVNSSAHTQRHATVPVSFLRQTIPPEVWHEEAHLHTHRWEHCTPTYTQVRALLQERVYRVPIQVAETPCCNMGWFSAQRGGTQHYLQSDEKVLHFTR